MNYQKIYNDLISRGKNRIFDGYTEKHHIIPKCHGGSNNNDNLVNLTAREHFVAHQLLIKIYPSNNGLVMAANCMCSFSEAHRGDRSRNRLYGWLREKLSISMSIRQTGRGNSQFGTMWITNGIETKKIKGEIPDGWVRGKAPSGEIWITNGIDAKKIKGEIPEGWVKGKTPSGEIWITNGIDAKKIKGEIPDGWMRGNLRTLTKIKKLEQNSIEAEITKNKKIEMGIKKEQDLKENIERRAIEKELAQNKMVCELQKLHEIYKVDGFDGVLEAGYKFSRQNLVMRFAKYLPEFVPQNGKSRKIK